MLRLFARSKRLQNEPLKGSGDTEVFDDGTYPGMLMIVWSFANAENAGLELELIPDDMVRWVEFLPEPSHEAF